MRSWQQVCHHSAISCDPKTCACKGYDTECSAQDLFRTRATERVWDMSQKFTQHGLWRFCQRNHVRFSRCVQLNPGMRNTSMCIHTHLQCIWILFVNICTLNICTYVVQCPRIGTYLFILYTRVHVNRITKRNLQCVCQMMLTLAFAGDWKTSLCFAGTCIFLWYVVIRS